MRIPIRSETDAFRTAVGVAALSGASILAAFAAAPIYGAVFFVVGAAVALLVPAREPKSGRPPALGGAAVSSSPGRRDGTVRVLVVANESLGGAELGRTLRSAGPRVEVEVLSPVLCSRLHYLANDYDAEAGQARERLDRSLAWADAQGFRAHGEVGDPSPATAVEDELRRFEADEVIVVTHPRERSNWAEYRTLDRVRRRLAGRVRHLVIDPQAGAVAPAL